MEIEVKDRATGKRQMIMKFKGKRDPVAVIHGYRFAAPVDVYVDGVLTKVPDPPVPPPPPKTKDDIFRDIFSKASVAKDSEAMTEKLWDAFDAVPSFGQALDAMDYALARKRGQKLKATGKLSQAETDMVLSHVPQD